MDIREATPDDAGFLAQMLDEAINWDPERPRVSLEETSQEWEELPRYIEDWGRPGDVGLVAEEGGQRVGAAWYRLYAAERPGFGFVDEDTPELSIALIPEARGRGIGTTLLIALLDRAREDGHEQISLNAELTNPARRLYERLGFVKVEIVDEDYQTMLLSLGDAPVGTR